jgi:hypothetical protein
MVGDKPVGSFRKDFYRLPGKVKKKEETIPPARTSTKLQNRSCPEENFALF